MASPVSLPVASSGEFPRATARVLGIVQGRDIDAQATLELEDHALVILWSRAAPWRLALDGIDGVSQGAAQLTLYLASGDVLELMGDDSLRSFGAQLMDRACAMPELTRGLRTLGSLRGTPGSAHDAWFAPLLSTRRTIEGVSDPLRQLALMDAARLAESMAKVLAELAAVQAPTDVPQQRAIEAVLEEHAEPLFKAIARLALAGNTLQGSALDTRLADWRRWVEALREVFVAADEGWGKAQYLVLSTEY